MHIITKHNCLINVYFVWNSKIYKGKIASARIEVHYDKQISKLVQSVEYGFYLEDTTRICWVPESETFDDKTKALKYRGKGLQSKPSDKPMFDKENEKLLKVKLKEVDSIRNRLLID